MKFQLFEKKVGKSRLRRDQVKSEPDLHKTYSRKDQNDPNFIPTTKRRPFAPKKAFWQTRPSKTISTIIILRNQQFRKFSVRPNQNPEPQIVVSPISERIGCSIWHPRLILIKGLVPECFHIAEIAWEIVLALKHKDKTNSINKSGHLVSFSQIVL